tara:strand:+ start:617 stop:1312 length:696 start_codon:yes stop_codon:yes gene_type:complete
MSTVVNYLNEVIEVSLGLEKIDYPSKSFHVGQDQVGYYSKNYKFYFTMRKPYDTTPIKWLFHLDCSCKHFYFYNEENEAKLEIKKFDDCESLDEYNEYTRDGHELTLEKLEAYIRFFIACSEDGRLKSIPKDEFDSTEWKVSLAQSKADQEEKVRIEEEFNQRYLRKNKINRIRNILGDHFNYKIEFYKMSDAEVLNFVHDFHEGKTEYRESDLYIRHDKEEIVQLLEEVK